VIARTLYNLASLGAERILKSLFERLSCSFTKL